MNSRVLDKIEAITEVIETLHVAIQDANRKLEIVQAERDELQHEQWRQRKELTTLHHDSEQFSELEDQNASLREIQVQLQTRLRGLLSDIKSLRSEMQP